MGTKETDLALGIGGGRFQARGRKSDNDEKGRLK